MFRTIDIERKEKLLTLYSNRIAYEWGKFITKIKLLSLNKGEMTKIYKAYDFAVSQDYGPRFIDKYYVTHPIRVARFLAEWCAVHSIEATGNYGNILCAGLLHNIIEKEIFTPRELARHYGKWISHSIATITLDRKSMTSLKGKRKYYRNLASEPLSVQAMKVFDKLDNLFILCINPDPKIRKKYLEEAEEFLLPIAQKATPECAIYLENLISDCKALGYYRPAEIPLEG